MNSTITHYPQHDKPYMTIRYDMVCGNVYQTYIIQAFCSSEGNREFARVLGAYRGHHCEPIQATDTVLLRSLVKDAISQFCDWYLWAREDQGQYESQLTGGYSSEEINYQLYNSITA